MGYLDRLYQDRPDLFGGVTVTPEEEDTTVVPERGFWGDTGAGLLRGFGSLAESAVLAGEAVLGESTWDERIAKTMRESKYTAPDVSEYLEKEGLVKRGYTGALEAIPSSIAPAAAGAAIGTAILPGLGTLAGGIVGAGLATFGFFGLSEGRRGYKQGLEAGLDEEEAKWYGMKKGLTEGGLETAAIVADIMVPMSGRLARVGVKGATRASLGSLLRQEPKKYATDMLKIWGVENLTEQAQLQLGGEIDKQYGLGDGVSWEERAETVAVTTWMSLFFGAAGVGFNATERARLKSDLTNPEKADAAADRIQSILRKEQPEVAENFRVVYEQAKRDGIGFSIDTDLAARSKDIIGKAQEEAQPRQDWEVAYGDYQPSIDEFLRDKEVPATPTDIGKPKDYGVDRSIPTLEEAAEASPRIDQYAPGYTPTRAADDPKLGRNIDIILQAQAEQRARMAPGSTIGQQVVPSPAPPQEAPTGQSRPLPEPTAPKPSERVGFPGVPAQALAEPPTQPVPRYPEPEPTVSEPAVGALAGPGERRLEDIPWTVEVVEEETGEIIKIETTAAEAIADTDQSIDKLYLIRECLRS